jgi:hypothetical protein
VLEIEYIASYIGHTACVLLAGWITLRVDRIAGIFLLYSFLMMASLSLVVWAFPDALSFEPKEEEGWFLDFYLVAPYWYKIFMLFRSMASITLPIGIYMLVKNATKNT